MSTKKTEKKAPATIGGEQVEPPTAPASEETVPEVKFEGFGAMFALYGTHTEEQNEVDVSVRDVLLGVYSNDRLAHLAHTRYINGLKAIRGNSTDYSSGAEYEKEPTVKVGGKIYVLAAGGLGYLADRDYFTDAAAAKQKLWDNADETQRKLLATHGLAPKKGK